MNRACRLLPPVMGVVLMLLPGGAAEAQSDGSPSSGGQLGGGQSGGAPSGGSQPQGTQSGNAQAGDSLLLGDAWGVRPFLARSGVTLGLSEISEVFGNATGGLHRGAAYDGVTELSIGVDLGKAIGLAGGTLNASAFQIHGRSLSSDNLEVLDTISGIEATRATRLWELWYDQSFAGGRLDAKIGVQSIDQEFIDSTAGALFANTMFGWPTLPAYDLYDGGPTYPLSALGVRGRARLGAFTLLAGVFDDNPGGGPFNDDPQPADGAQPLFDLKTGALFTAELDYALNKPGADGSSPGLPGTYKIGAWFDTAAFPDPLFDDRHDLFSGPNSDNNPLLRRHNYSLYAVMDQTVWRPSPRSARSIAVFARVMGAPGDRNPISFAANMGWVLYDPLPKRDGDMLGFGAGFTGLGSHERQDSRVAQRNSDGAYMPVLSGETYLELFYQCSATGWLTVQPDLQYIFMPDGGVSNPGRAAGRVSNEFVAGVRATVTF